ncbi:MAG: ABC transporter permease [Candidatus Sumerlaeaceae bacterium]
MSTALKRFLQAIPTLLGVSILVFCLLRLSGDPVRSLLPPDATREQIILKRQELHLDEPIPVQYWYWLRDALRGNFGVSWVGSQRPVAPDLIKRIPATLELAVTTMAIATFLAISVGLLSSRKPYGFFDNTSRTVIFVFLAAPAFWLGIELIIIFSRRLQLLPPAGRGHGTVWDHLRHLALPSITLGVGTAAALCRVLRSSMLETLSSDFVRTARAKGVSGKTVLVHHAFRNALIPFVTLSGLSIAGLLEGSIIVESIFAWPGLGQWMVDGIKGGDTPVVMAGVLTIAVVYTLVNLAVDLLYTVIDPRIRIGGSAK